MISKIPKRVFSYCPVELQNRIDMKISVLNSLEEHAGNPEDVMKTFPDLTKKFVRSYVNIIKIAREYELNVKHSNEINKYLGVLKN